MTTYRGDVSWIVIEEEGAKISHGIPTRTFVLEGRADQTTATLAQYRTGSTYAGGYVQQVIDRQRQGPFNQIEIRVAYLPDVNVTRTPSAFTVRNATKSGQLDNTSLIAGVAHYYVRRDITYRSPTARFSYFSSSQPNGPRFTSGAGIIRKIKDHCTVDFYDADWKWISRDEVTYSQLRSELKSVVPVTRESTAELDASPITGTPWWDCIDTVTYDLKGDDTAP